MQSDCIKWDKHRNDGGYGVRRYQGKLQLAHRVAFAEANGYPIIDLEGWIVLHSCDNPPCVNPKHLSFGTSRDNSLDSARKGRHRDAKGIKNGRTKLTEDQVAEIKSSTDLQKNLAKRFNVSHQLISEIKRGNLWNGVKIE